MSRKIGNTNASKRRQLAVEAARIKIRAGQCINQLRSIERELRGSDADVQRLKARADIWFGLLRKVVPDLRAVEHSGHVEQTIQHVAVSEADRRIEALLSGREDRDSAQAVPH